MKQYINLAVKTITRHKLRTALTIFSIVIGIAAIVSMISITKGLQTTLTNQFESFGNDKLFISPSTGMFSPFSEPLDDKSLDVIKKVSKVEMAAPMIYRSAPIKFNNKIFYGFVIGMPADETKVVFQDISTFKTSEGRLQNEGEDDKIVMGYLYANDDKYFGRTVGLDDTVEVQGERFKVIGFINKIGNPNDDTQAYITLDKAKELFDVKDYQNIIVKVTDMNDLENIKKDIEKKLLKAKNLEKDEKYFSIMSTQEMTDAFNNIMDVIGYVLIGIALISLIVGGIGIMNVMYTSILERTREIGTLKALGATNTAVFTIFIAESSMMSVVGGIIGILIGYGFSTLVSIAANYAGFTFKIYYGLDLTLGMLLFSVLIGIASGYFPAKRAAELNVVDALRYE